MAQQSILCTGESDAQRRRCDGPTRVVHGACDGKFDLVGVSVRSVRVSLVDAFNIPAESVPFVNGEQVTDDYRIRAFETLEFVKQRGEKSILDPHEQAQLDRIEEMLSRLLGSTNRLTEREEEILEALSNKKMIGEDIAAKAGYEYDGHFKALLSSMVKRGVLLNDHPGYRKPKSGRGQD